MTIQQGKGNQEQWKQFVRDQKMTVADLIAEFQNLENPAGARLAMELELRCRGYVRVNQGTGFKRAAK